MADTLSFKARITLEGFSQSDLNRLAKQLDSKVLGKKTLDINLSSRSTSNIKSLNKNLRTTKTLVDQNTASMQKFGAEAAFAFRRFGAFTAAVGLFRRFSGAVETAVKDSFLFERELVKIGQVSNKTLNQLRPLREEVFRLATTYGVSADSILNAARTLTQAGIASTEVKRSLDTLAKTELAPTFGNISQTTEAMIAIFRQFGTSSRDLEGQFDSINSVASKFAVESNDIVQVIRKAGGVFKSSGGDLNELIALFTAVRSTTRETADSIGTGLRTIIVRLQRAELVEELESLGIKLRDSNNLFVGPFKALEKISEKLKSLDPRSETVANIREAIGGFRQISRVTPLVQNFEQANRALNVALNAQGSLAEDNAQAQESVLVQFNKLREEFGALISDIQNSPAFREFALQLIDVGRAAIALVDKLQPILPLLAGLAAFRFGKGFVEFSKGFVGQTKKFAAAGLTRNSGGLIPGRGPNKDSVLTYLTKGEYVIQRDAVDALGVDKLDAINKIQKRNSGGIIGLNSGGSVNSGGFTPVDTNFAQVIKDGVQISISELSKSVTSTGEFIANAISEASATIFGLGAILVAASKPLTAFGVSNNISKGFGFGTDNNRDEKNLLKSSLQKEKGFKEVINAGVPELKTMNAEIKQAEKSYEEFKKALEDRIESLASQLDTATARETSKDNVLHTKISEFNTFKQDIKNKKKAGIPITQADNDELYARLGQVHAARIDVGNATGRRTRLEDAIAQESDFSRAEDKRRKLDLAYLKEDRGNLALSVFESQTGLSNQENISRKSARKLAGGRGRFAKRGIAKALPTFSKAAPFVTNGLGSAVKTGGSLLRSFGGLGALATVFAKPLLGGIDKVFGNKSTGFGSSFLGTAGGAASGAGIGATIGSVIPGLGTAVGAGIGGAVGFITDAAKASDDLTSYLNSATFGLIGFTTAAEDSAKKLAEETFSSDGKLAKDLDNALKGFSKSKLGLSEDEQKQLQKENRDKLVTAGGNTLTALNTIGSKGLSDDQTAAIREDLSGDVGEAAQKVRDEFEKLASANPGQATAELAKNFKNPEAALDLLSYNLSLTNNSLTDLDKQFKIAGQEFSKVNKATAQYLNDLGLRNQVQSAIQGAEFARSEFTVSSNANQGNFTQIDRASLFSRAADGSIQQRDDFSGNQFEAALQQISSFGGVAKPVADTARTEALITRELPLIFERVAKTGGDSGEVFKQLKSVVGDSFGGDDLISRIREDFGNTFTGDEVGFSNATGEQIAQFSEQIKNSYTENIKSSEAFQSAIQENNGRLQEELNKRISIENELSQNIKSATQTRFNGTDRLRPFITQSGKISQQEAAQRDSIQLGDILRNSPLGGNASVGQLENRLIGLQGDRKQASINQDVTEFTRLNEEVKSVTQALEFMRDSSEEAAVIQRKLTELQERQTSGQDFAIDYLTADNAGRKKLEKDFENAQFILAGGNLQGPQAADALNVIGKLQGEDVRRQQAARLIGPAGAELFQATGLTEAGKPLVNNLQAINNKQNQAGNALVNNTANQVGIATQDIQAMTKTFEEVLQLLLQRDEATLDAKQAGAITQKVVHEGSFTHDVNINLNGAEIMSGLEPSIQKMIIKTTNQIVAESLEANGLTPPPEVKAGGGTKGQK